MDCRQKNQSAVAMSLAIAALITVCGCEPGTDSARLIDDRYRPAWQDESYDDQFSSARNEPIHPLVKPQGLSSEKVELGKTLFHDVRLSADNSISCATCHRVKEGGDDGLPTSIGIAGKTGGLNAPTVLNSSLLIAQFWDGRAKNLKEQVPGPVHNPIEMGSDWKEVIAKLKKDRKLVAAFEKNYAQGLTPDNIIDAIVNYENALVTVGAPFDKYLLGDDDAVSPKVLKGYQLFKSLGCISCHQGKLVGGNMLQQFGVMGEFEEHFEDSSESSRGRINVTQRKVDLHRFKVPSLRNVAQTAPYFHNGCTQSLEEAIRVMARFQLGETLTATEVDLIKAFLVSLNGETPKELQ